MTPGSTVWPASDASRLHGSHRCLASNTCAYTASNPGSSERRRRCKHCHIRCKTGNHWCGTVHQQKQAATSCTSSHKVTIHPGACCSSIGDWSSRWPGWQVRLSPVALLLEAFMTTSGFSAIAVLHGVGSRCALCASSNSRVGAACRLAIPHAS